MRASSSVCGGVCGRLAVYAEADADIPLRRASSSICGRLAVYAEEYEDILLIRLRSMRTHSSTRTLI